ncbi:methionine--tRNA ligase [Candidatus Micrarchaeota archaeon]|nr:methionine--tRNA ligase [Candidatus Micrarchaeota archaeon]
MIEISKFYLTTAIPYVNAAPHIGHALEFVQTDAIARYHRLLGNDVALVTGADENSLKNVHAAEAKGISTAQLCEQNAEIFKQLAEKIGLSYTDFLRTSIKESHWPGVNRLWELLAKSGDIYKKKYTGLYCVGCESFYEESELPEGVCPEHNKKPEIVEEENYFFKLSRYQDELESLIETNELQVLPETRKNEVLSFIRSGLQDFSISRSVARAKGWGVPVPGDESQIQYVWLDALGTYLTGIGYGTNEEKFKKYWPADVHVIGKGILRFHAVYWPAFLLSAGLALPKTIFVHGYITVEGQKMSKSIGNIVDPFSLIEKYGSDPLRYYFLSEVPTFADGDFSEKLLIEKNNNELAANIGNLVNRTMVFLTNNYAGEIPKAEPSDSENTFLDSQKAQIEKITSLLDELKLKEAMENIMAFSSNANKFFQDQEPWKKIKEGKEKAAPSLYVLINQVKDLAILLAPFLPNTSASIFKQLGTEPQIWEELGILSINAGHRLGKPEILFKKL